MQIRRALRSCWVVPLSVRDMSTIIQTLLLEE